MTDIKEYLPALPEEIVLDMASLHKVRMYWLISKNNKTGEYVPLTTKPFTHAECMTIKSKFTEHSFRTITIIEA